MRTPAYSYHSYHDEKIQKLLREPFFRSAIYVGSSSLYGALKKKDFNYKALSPKETLALRRYLNRMCFRPTPFGLFSGFSTVEWGNNNSSIQSGQEMKTHINFSHSHSVWLARRLLNGSPFLEQAFVCNNTLYKVGKEYRYIRYDENLHTGERDFFIDSFPETDLIEKILLYVEEKRTITKLVQFVSPECDASESEIHAFIEQLISEQIILPALIPNITGKDYLMRINAMGEEMTGYSPDLKEIQLKINSLSSLPGEITMVDLEEKLPGGNPGTGSNVPPHHDLPYVNLEKPGIVGALDTKYQKKILDGLYCIDKLLSSYPIAALEEFASAFTGKFGLRTVPLLYALDPEAGVGYASLAEDHPPSGLLSDIHMEHKNHAVPSVEWTPVHQLLLNKWTSLSMDKNETGSILITKEDLENLPLSDEDYSLPPSVSVLFRISDDRVYIEQAGGASALALSGRFTPFNDSILKMAKEIAGIETTANPDVILAEIAHIDNLHTANIDRREAVRDYEIPLMAASCRDHKFRIPPDDLWVNVRGDKILLWSKSLQKNIIPRLSSAYNYTRSELPVFRFLCDLQNQGIKTNFSFDLASFFPGLSFYPRVRYHAAIIQLATWHVKKEQFQHIPEQKPGADQFISLKGLLRELHCPEYISVNEGDKQMVLDCRKDIDMEILLKEMKNKEAVIIKEFPFIHEKKPLISDTFHDPYIHQFAASLYHHKKIYHPLSPPPMDSKSDGIIIRRYLPGSEWLYFKIYCHPLRANEILTQRILSLTRHWVKKNYLKKWFFICYHDPEYHLRIRFNIQAASAQKIITDFTKACSDLISNDIINDFQIAVYERESERYTPGLIEEVENVFSAGSLLTVEYLKMVSSGRLICTLSRFAFLCLDTMLDIFQYSLPDRECLFHQLYDSFYAEFIPSGDLRNQLKTKFREIRHSFQQKSECGHHSGLSDIFSTGETEAFKNAHIALAEKVQGRPPAQKNRLAGDIIHMHLNRLFQSDQRKQETILYYCLWRHYESVRLREQSNAKFSACFSKAQN